MVKKLILILLILSPVLLKAQDTLPNLSVRDISNNILISWTNNYTTLSNIKIQRSIDSLKGFTTIGSVLNVFNKTNGFVDAKPPFHGMFYRVFLSFEGGSYIFSPSFRPVKDTTRTMINLNDNQVVVNTWFEPSKRVYTGKDNNVIISLPDATKKKYSIKFFEENGNFLFEIKKITEAYLTLEKVNFLRSGLFVFELYDDETIIEKYKLYIPKDGKIIPATYEMSR